MSNWDIYGPFTDDENDLIKAATLVNRSGNRSENDAIVEVARCQNPECYTLFALSVQTLTRNKSNNYPILCKPCSHKNRMQYLNQKKKEKTDKAGSE